MNLRKDHYHAIRGTEVVSALWWPARDRTSNPVNVYGKLVVVVFAMTSSRHKPTSSMSIKHTIEGVNSPSLIRLRRVSRSYALTGNFSLPVLLNNAKNNFQRRISWLQHR